MKQTNLLPVLIFSALILTPVACGKKEEKRSTPSPTPSVSKSSVNLNTVAGETPAAPTPPPTAAPTEAAPAAAAAAAEAPVAADQDAVTKVTYALQSFSIAMGRNPSSLDELIKSGYLKALPAPPAGKKFKFDPDRMTLTLVNQ
ncbi:MAG TPA: hypothetical protein VK968_03270 [Roseimicrobium sp.]|nr:hypothetical protein [Roseimicrobium sp.]